MKRITLQIAQIAILILSFSFRGFAQINLTELSIDDDVHGTAGIYACDLDNDSDIDVLGASQEDDQIIWWRNDGGIPISWTKIVIGYNVGEAHSVQAADINGDGDIDVVGAAYVGTPGIAWWRNDGGNPVVWTKFTVADNFINAHEIFVYDLDQDSDPDILGASSDLNRIAWWRNEGGNPVAWTEQIISSNVTLAKSVTAGDLDGDQDIDVIGMDIINNDVIWWRNDGGEPIQWTQFLVDGNFGGAHRVQAVDIDNDGRLDLLGAGYLGHQIAWWRNNGGNPIVWTKQIIGSNFTNACIAYSVDLDDDGDKDVIGTGQAINQIAWWRNDGGEPIKWTKFIITDSFIRPWPLYAEDLDGDQDYDIIVGSSHAGSNQVHWWRNDSITGSDSTDRIAFSITAPDGYADIFLINADGSGKNQLTNQPERPYGPAFSPDAEQIAFYNHFDDQTWHLYIMNANGADISQLTNQQNVLDWSPDWSPDGSKIVFARSYAAPVWRSEILLINPDGSDLHPLGSLDGQGPDWSPDGLKIVYFNYVEGGGDIWIANADGTNPIKLTDDPAEDWWPKFSPDGNKIAFQSRRDGNFEIYVMDSDGSNLTRITNNSADDEDPNWSPDGEKIAFISMRDGHYEIYTMNVDGSDQTRITTTDGQAVDPDWKPVITLTSVEENGESWNALPKNFRLFQNYPNPFNPATRIDFEIIEPGFATLRIYNLFGQEVDKLINKHMPKGVHSVDWNCMNLPGGVYYYRLSNHLGSDTKKMVITD